MIHELTSVTAPVLVIAASTLAQASGVIGEGLSPLLNVGALGAVLAWFLLKTEPRLRRMEEANDRQSRIVLLAVLAMAEGKPLESVKAQAHEMEQELDRAEDSRK